MGAEKKDRASLAERIFPGGGEMATCARALEWGATGMGPMSSWPETLRVAATIAISSTLPMAVFWGPARTTLCNDALAALLGRGARAGALGWPAEDTWPDVWTALGPFVERVASTGHACTTEDLRIFVGPASPRAEVSATFSLSPLRNEDGEVDGIFCAVVETTAQQAPTREPAAQVIQRYESRLREMALEQSRAEQRERRRIATDLHDRIGQSLAVAQMKLAQVRAATNGEARVALEDATRMLEDAITDTRSLIFEISPPILFDLGLPAALSWLAERLEERHGVHVQIQSAEGMPPLDDADLASLVFRIIQELLMNVIKHAHVEQATVRLEHTGSELRIDVSDGGVGFDAARVLASGHGFGLFSAREQALRVGGRFEVVSAKAGGTSVRIAVPVVANSGKPSDRPRGTAEGGAT